MAWSSALDNVSEAHLNIIEADLENNTHCDAILSLLQAYSRDQMGAGAPLKEPVAENLIDGLKTHPTTEIFLAQSVNQFVGMAICFAGFSTFNAKRLLNIHDLTVLPEARGQGVGRALLKHIAETVKAKGYCKVTLEVREDNQNAYQLYQSEGFAAGDCDGQSVQYLFLEKRL